MSISLSFYMIIWMRNESMVVGCRKWVGCWRMAISISRGVVMGCSMVSVGVVMTLGIASASMVVTILMLVAMVGCVMVSITVGVVIAVVQARVPG